jgi:hypothetical protein
VSSYRARPVEGGKHIEVHVTFTGKKEPGTWTVPKEYLPHCDTTEVRDQSLVVGADGGVDGAVAWLDDIQEGAPLEDVGRVEQDQKGCVFAPHVIAMGAPGQLRLMNSDPANHAVRMDFTGPRKLDDLTKVVPPRLSVTLDVKPEWAGEVAKITCPMHLWMWGYVHFFEHPYFGVTKDGVTKIAKVPPGTYHLTVWHEALDATYKDIIAIGEPKTARVELKIDKADVVKSFTLADDGTLAVKP